MNSQPPARSPFDHVPFVVRAMLAGALALSMMCLSAALGLTLLFFAVGASPAHHARVALPGPVTVLAIRSKPKCAAAAPLTRVRLRHVTCGPLMAAGRSIPLVDRLPLRALLRRTFE